MKRQQQLFKAILKCKNLQLSVLAVLVISSNVNGQTSSYSSNNNGVLGDDNCAFGLETLWNWNWLSSSDPNTGSRNSAFGRLAMNYNTYGNNNSAFGSRSLFQNTTGNDNSAIGYRSLYSNTTGWNNEAYGSNALYSNTNGAYNTASGSNALYSVVSGNRNCAYGFQALNASKASNSTAIGFRSLYLNTTGSDNAACGLGSLSTNTTGSYNTGMGNYADVSTSNLSNATALGYLAVVNASNKVRFANASVTVVEGPVAYTVSDGRFKTNVKEDDVKGLEFIMKLRPVVYNFDTKKLTEFWTKNMSEDVRKQHLNQDFTTSTNIRQSGFIAQEVEEAAKNVNYDFNGVHVPENENDNYSLAYGEFVVPLVKGMQEQQKMIDNQKQMIEEQKLINEKLQQQINDLQKGIGNTTGIGNNLSIAGASMEQNVPNPFSHETVITFTLPHQINNAYMTVYDLSGREMKTMPITKRGNASITITSEQLEAGMYIYSIVADGKIVDSKRMVVTGK